MTLHRATVTFTALTSDQLRTAEEHGWSIAGEDPWVLFRDHHLGVQATFVPADQGIVADRRQYTLAWSTVEPVETREDAIERRIASLESRGP